ncbi:hypothetical protein NM688_g3303 [Phlebia brevispora]|uniref:Uncharacterized protein n=1 Tax=Phlebia brevispora TaxID=194682 RepID=A0ACC1T607_9APHY|nr:hypothetical protein NM688_g3303 [Phlebia brevispora]
MPIFTISEISLQSLSVADLEHVSNQSSFGRYMVTRELAARHHRMLTPYFTDTNTFMAMLRSFEAVISGSFALDYILGKESTPQSDLDIYVPFASFEGMKTYLKDVEGYSEDAMLMRRRAKIARALAARQEEAIERMINGSPEYVTRVPVHFTQSRAFGSTLQMNYVCASGYCCAYPQATFRLEGVVSPHVMRNDMTPYDFVYPLIDKYERRRYEFRFNWYEPEITGCGNIHEHVFCPSKRRSFEDALSYYGTFGSGEDSPTFNDRRGAFVSDWKVGWQLGSRHDPTDTRFPSPARAWHSVTGQGERRTRFVPEEPI